MAEKPLHLMGQANTTSRIHSPISDTIPGQLNRSVAMNAPTDLAAFRKMLDRTGRNALARAFPAEWKAFKGMKERQRTERERTGLMIVHPKLSTFKQFLRHLGPCPSAEHYTLDRIHTLDREYAPGKVRWATPTEQANNRRNTILLPYNGKAVPLSVVARETGMKADTMRKRRERGWTDEEVARGKRFSPSCPATTLPQNVADGSGPWPKGTTLSKWSPPFEAWRAVMLEQKITSGVTPAVFMAWIATNCYKALGRILEDRHGVSLPWDHERHAFNPNLPAVLREDPIYREFVAAQRGANRARSMIAGDPTQEGRLRWLRTEHPTVTKPAAAPARFRPRPDPRGRY